jgi:hypothetical protein
MLRPFVVLLVLYAVTSASAASTGAKKPGECPEIKRGTVGECPKALICTNDGGCLDKQKCCFNGCGYICKDPVVKTPVAQKECKSPGPCLRPCPGGYKYDKDNCQTCQCYDPCLGYKCPTAGTVCKPALVECLIAPCIPPSVPNCVKP